MRKPCLQVGVVEFANLAHTSEAINWTMGSVPHDGGILFFWNIDVPDFNDNLMPLDAQIVGGYKFTVRMVPNPNPEPATITMLGLGAISLSVYGWCWRRRAARA